MPLERPIRELALKPLATRLVEVAYRPGWGWNGFGAQEEPDRAGALKCVGQL
jgi:hypothetical protein